jgi:trigger factor
MSAHRHDHTHDHDHDHPHDHDHGHAHDHDHDGSDLAVATSEEGANRRRLDVTVPLARVQSAYERAYRDIAKSARIKGFRPGKVPRAVLEKMYGASIGEEIERLLVNETLGAALAKAGVEPVAQPAVDAAPPRADREFTYKVLVEVRPPIELPALEGLPGARPVVLVGDDEVERELAELRRRHAPLIEEPPGTAAANGHIVTIDFVGRIDGVAFEGGTGRDVELELGSGRFIPGFEEQLVGAAAGEDRVVNTTFPENYGSAELAGKAAAFSVHVAEVKRRELPALDDEFAKDLGEYETIGALRDRIHQDLRESREQTALAALRRSVLGALVERSAFDVPPGATDGQLERRLRLAVQQLHQGVPHDVLQAQVERWREEWRPAAEREVRERWLLDAVAESRELAVPEEAIAEQVERMAAAQGVTAPALREQVGDELLEASIRSDLLREQALDFLVSTAKVEEVTDT